MVILNITYGSRQLIPPLRLRGSVYSVCIRGNPTINQ
jgi:hypothetical protein